MHCAISTYPVLYFVFTDFMTILEYKYQAQNIAHVPLSRLPDGIDVGSRLVSLMFVILLLDY